MFMAFDIIATGPSSSDSHVDKPFTERLRILNDFLSDEYVLCYSSDRCKHTMWLMRLIVARVCL